MNLLQVQDQLKSLPSDPRTMQALMAYANGANPAVPPYLALGELNRRKQLMEKAQMEQASQPPQGTVKDQVEQQAGIMALQAGRQQQAMQNAVRMGSAMPQGAPAGIPQPQAQPEVGAAGGGLMALLADKAKAKRMNSGGIVALAPAGSVAAAQDETNDETEDEAKIDAEGFKTADAMRELVKQRMLAERLIKNMKAPSAESPMEFRARMIKEKPEFAYLAEDPEKDVVGRLDELQAARRAELAKQREEAQQLKPGILQLMGRAALQSRGQQGRSALASILGGYEQLSSGEEAKSVQQEQALRAKDLEMQQAKMEVITKLRELKRARDEGDIDGEQKAKMDLAKLNQQHNGIVAKLVGSMATTAGSVAGRMYAADTAAKAKVKAAGMTKPPRETDLDKVIGAHMSVLVAEGADPNDPQTKLAATQRATRDLSKSAASVRAETTQTEKANEAFENKLLMDKTLRALRRSDPVAYEQRIEQLREDIKKDFGIRPDRAAPKAEAAPAKPTQPTAARITPAEFDKKWAALKSGQSLEGPDGKIYTKK